jgi:uncharacterized membrane protein YfcA
VAYGLELAWLAVWCFAVALAGGMLGLVLGTLRLPFFLLLASSPAAGAGANIGVSAVAAAVGAAGHLRAGRVNGRLVAWMAPPSVAGALAGGYLSALVPARALLAGIGLLLLAFGVSMLRRRAEIAARGEGEARLGAAVVAGAWIGLLGGLVGLILGTLRMPALLGRIGESPHRAVGTNLAVGVFLGVAGVLGHAAAGTDWTLLAVGGGASAPGALLGARATGRLRSETLVRAIAVVLLVVACVTLAQAAAG